MPIGIISDEDFDREVDNTPIVMPKIIQMDKPGRSPGDLNVPDSLRRIIGETAIEDGRQDALELAESFGISASSVSAYTNGATSTKSYNKPNEELISSMNDKRLRIANKAQKKLMMTLKHLTSDKLEGADAREISGVAKDMASVYDKMQPKADPRDSVQVQFVLYQPEMKRINDYKIIDVESVTE